MAPSRRSRVIAAALLAVYSAFVAFVGFWPVPVDRPFDTTLLRLLGRLGRFGIRPLDAYNALESGMNILFFVPAGFLLVLVLGWRRWWLAPLIGFAASCLIELGQYFLLTARYATVADVAANTAGAILGAAAGALVLWRGRRRAAP